MGCLRFGGRGLGTVDSVCRVCSRDGCATSLTGVLVAQPSRLQGEGDVELQLGIRPCHLVCFMNS